MGRYNQALDAYNEALPLAKARNISTERGRVLVGIGLLKMVRGRLDDAVDYLKEAAALFEDGRKSSKKDEASELELYEQIGRLKMELEWLKKKAADFD